MRVLGSCVATVLLGCSSGGPAVGADAGVPDGSRPPHDGGRLDGAVETGPRDSTADSPTRFPAAHPAMPQEVNLGGPVMASPKFVVITFAGDALAPMVDDLVDKIAGSKTYWSATTAEYGVGPVVSVLHVTVNETPGPSLGDTDVQAWLAQKLTGPDAGTLDGGAAWPKPDGQTLYMIYYPDGVGISQGGGASCSAFYGYHNDFVLSPKTFVSYSVIARCPPFPMTSAIDSVAAIASHELVEAVTDPLPQDRPAWAHPDKDHTAWELPAGGELGDLCAAYGNVFIKPADVPYLVQRTWSNKAAAAGHDPCQPQGAAPYFNAAAVLTGTVTDSDPVFGTFTTKGIKVPVGGTGTIELDLYSDAPTSAAWTVQAFDLSSLFGGPAELELSFGGKAMATGKNGDKVQLDVKVLQQGPGGAEVLWIQSSLGSVQTVWLGLVSN